MVITARKLAPTLQHQHLIYISVLFVWQTCDYTCVFDALIKPRWRTRLWRLKHWQPDTSDHIRPIFPATSQSSLTLTPTSKHLWVRTAFHCHVEKNPKGLEYYTKCVFLQTFREPVSDYQVLREKAASQRRDVERALTRFMAKTGETQSLFKDDITTFPREANFMWKICINVYTHSYLLSARLLLDLCCQWLQRGRVQFHILVPSCPRSWNCRVLRRRIHQSRTTRRTARTRQGISSL